MDGVSWSTTRAQESFSRPGTAAQTLTRLATFIARADSKQQRTRSQKAPPPAFSCQECGKGFPYATELLQHQELKHTLPKPHRCPACGQEFSLRSSLQLHKCTGEPPPPCVLCRGEPRLGSPCPACAACSLDPAGPKSPHRQPHLVDRSPYACAPCGRGFNQKQALLHHQQAGCSKPPSPLDAANSGSLPYDSPPVSEGDSAHSDSPGPSGRGLIVCQLCSRSFRVVEALQRHVQTYHGNDAPRGRREQKTKEAAAGGEARKSRHEQPDADRVKASKAETLLSCRTCDMVFRSTSKLYMHRRDKHSREANARREPRPVVSKRKRGETYPCLVCGRLFLHHLSLKAHCRQHHASSVFPPAKTQGQPIGRSTKDTRLLETRPNKSKLSAADPKTAKAAPARPKKAENKLGDADKYRKVPVADEDEELEEPEFPCPSCAEVFSLQSQLKEHMELHQSSLRRRQCSVCASEMDPCKLPSSKRQRLYHCVPCQQGFSALDTFLEHCQEHLRVRVEEDNIMEGYTHHASKA